MIGLEEFQKRTYKLLEIFKKRTKAIACTLISKDGFIISSLKDDFIDNHLFEKKIIKLYTEFELMSEENIGLVDFYEKRELISFGIVGEYFSEGFMILIKAITEELILIIISPILISSTLILTEFDKLVNEFSKYFSGAEYQGIFNELYKNKLYNII